MFNESSFEICDGRRDSSDPNRLGCSARAADTNYELKPISLPGASGVVSAGLFCVRSLDGRIVVPASNTASVDVIDEDSDAVSQVTGFKTGEVELRGRKITLGPTSVSIGDGVVYIGNRGDSSLCHHRLAQPRAWRVPAGRSNFSGSAAAAPRTVSFM